jgi:hypothetical protein
MRKPRIGALVLSVLLLAATAGVVSASTVHRSTNVVTFGGTGFFSATTTFSASWTEQSFYSEGQYELELTNFALFADVSGGQNCHDPQCVTWYYGASVTFYNAAGSVVGSFNNAVPGSCGIYYYAAVGDMLFDRCKSFYYPAATATKMKIHWSISVTNGTGWTTVDAWKATTGYIAIP